ncbi:MAG: dienelactone hydrolase family protein [Flammeovirgaceae bacterium]
MIRKSIYFILIAMAVIACSPSNTEKPTDNETKESETPVEKIVGQEISYEADSITMKGYLAYDQTQEGKRPCVLVVHEWWGHNEYARKRADMLAEMGYIALAVDMYGDGKTADHPADAGKFSGAVFKDIEGAKMRFEKALETLKAHAQADPEKTAAIGYCFGGGIILNMARMGVDLDAVVSFHGSLGAVQPAQNGIQTKILVCNGAADPFVKPEQIEAFKKEMDEANADYKFVNYEGAVHAFTNPGATTMGEKFDLPLAYQEKADQESWAEMTTFLKNAFGAM